MLILSAPVGAGHDAAAAALAVELREAGAQVEVIDGLAPLGLERLVVGGYRFQILHAAWSWRMLYRITRRRTLIRLAGAALARVAGRRLIDHIRQSNPDVIVSAYPIVSMTLAALRRRARLPWPCATLVTDFEPHPAWIHPDLDTNLVVREPTRGCVRINPPIASVHTDAETRRRVRTELGVPADARVALIVGGAWGVGNLHGAAQAVAATTAHPIIVTARNHHLRRALQRDHTLTLATILGYTHRMPDLMAAADVLIQNAGGLTCLEAFGAGIPVVMFDPLPGHGEENTYQMHLAGLVTVTPDTPSLQTLIRSKDFWATHAPAQAARAKAPFTHQPPGPTIARLAHRRVNQPGHLRRRAPIAAIACTLGAWFAAENLPTTNFDAQQPPHTIRLTPAAASLEPPTLIRHE